MIITTEFRQFLTYVAADWFLRFLLVLTLTNYFGLHQLLIKIGLTTGEEGPGYAA